MDVTVIYRLDSLSIKLPKGTGIKNMSARGDYYQDDHANFADVAEYLENYGIVGMVVVDESNDIEHYKIELKFSPEEKGSFQAALKKMGLGIKKAQRVIEVLVIY